MIYIRFLRIIFLYKVHNLDYLKKNVCRNLGNRAGLPTGSFDASQNK